MKARVKLTGKIIDVEVKVMPRIGFIGTDVTGAPITYMEPRFYDGEFYYQYDELDFNVETLEYRERLKHQYAGMAMSAMLASPSLLEVVTETSGLTKKEYADKVACAALIYAEALVDKIMPNNE